MKGNQSTIRPILSPGLTLAKGREVPLLSACLSLLILFFIAGFIIGYAGYFEKKSIVHPTPSPPATPRIKINRIPQIQSHPIKIDVKSAPEKVKPPQPPVPVKKKPIVFHPFTLRLACYRTKEDALRGLAYFREKALNPYLLKIDLEENGIWWNVYSGHFASEKDAVAVKRKLVGMDAIIKKMPYANLIGIFSSLEGADQISRKIEAVTGFPPYAITGDDRKIRLFSGRFISIENAKALNIMLKHNGIEAEVVKR